jgi:hypothetical protein
VRHAEQDPPAIHGRSRKRLLDVVAEARQAAVPCALPAPGRPTGPALARSLLLPRAGAPVGLRRAPPRAAGARRLLGGRDARLVSDDGLGWEVDRPWTLTAARWTAGPPDGRSPGS